MFLRIIALVETRLPCGQRLVQEYELVNSTDNFIGGPLDHMVVLGEERTQFELVPGALGWTPAAVSYDAQISRYNQLTVIS